MTDATDLRRLVDIPLDKEDDDLRPFLDTAALIRSEDLAGSGLSLSRLDQIELYLAAHFCVLSIEKGGLNSSKQGQSQEQYRTPDSKLTGFNATSFGQMAVALDTSDTLINLSTTKKALFSIVGRSGNATIYPPLEEPTT